MVIPIMLLRGTTRGLPSDLHSGSNPTVQVALTRSVPCGIISIDFNKLAKIPPPRIQLKSGIPDCRFDPALV